MTPVEHAVYLLTWVRSISDMMLKDLPESALLLQARPTDNHPLWTVGHLACTDAWMGSILGFSGAAVPDSYNALFGSGTKPAPHAKEYPSYPEVKAHFDSGRAATLAWIQSAAPSALSEPLKAKTGGFATDAVDFAYKLAWHEGWHFGQVASVRKALGLKSVVG